VQSNGTGSLNVGDGPLQLDLAAFNAEGVAGTILLRSSESDNDQGTGIAVHK
jgi:hypothetical protein